MIRLFLLLVFCFGFGKTVLAQHDPVVMRVNGKEVPRSEFEYFYKKGKNSIDADSRQLAVSANRFADIKLKIAAAETAGLDTSRILIEEQNSYRRRLTKTYLTDKETTERAVQGYYDKMKSSARYACSVRIKHIFTYLPQNITGQTLHEKEIRMDSIYNALTKGTAGEDFFDACVERFSDEKEPFWINRLQMPVEFEEVVFGLQVGEISRPFFTPQGIHIVKVLERKELPSFEEVKDEIARRQSRHWKVTEGTRALVEKLKKEYGYVADKAGVAELLAKGKTNRVLFTLDGKKYVGSDFARFAAAYPAGIRRQLEGFITKTILDYEDERLEEKHPEFRMLVRAHRDSMLLAEVVNREIGRGLADEAGLKAYFESHRSDYYWDEPRYKGIVLHGATKRVVKQARKFLKQIPEAEWMDAIRLTFNAGGSPQIQAEQGVFAPGDNEYVDKLVFKTGGVPATPMLSFPFTAVQGCKRKGPDCWTEVRDPLTAAYRQELERRWMTRLRATGKVEIDQEVLKTVNNH